jgi:hypothetical protein
MFDLPEQIEKVIEALPRAVLSILATIFFLLFRPATAGRRYADVASRFTKPYSFVGLSSFVAVKTARVAMYLLLMISVAIQRSCSGGDTPAISEQEYLKSQLSIPSLDSVLELALPVVIAVLILSWILSRWKGINPARDPDCGSRISGASCYVVGCQLLVVAPMAALIFLGLGNFLDHHHLITWPALVPACICLFVWPSWCFVSYVRGTIASPVAHSVMKPLSRRAVWFAGLLVSTLPLAVTLALAYPLANHDVQTIGARPALRAAVLSENTAQGGYLLQLELENETDSRLHFCGGDMSLESSTSRVYAGEAVEQQGAMSSIDLGPHSAAAVRVRVWPIPAGNHNSSTTRSTDNGRIELAGYFLDGTPSCRIRANFREGVFDDRGWSSRMDQSAAAKPPTEVEGMNNAICKPADLLRECQ